MEITFFLSISRSRDTVYEFLVLCPQWHHQLCGKTRKMAEDEHELIYYFYILYILLLSSISELEPKFQILVLFNVWSLLYPHKTFSEICRRGSNTFLRPDTIRPWLEAPAKHLWHFCWHMALHLIKRFIFIKLPF